MCIILSDLFDEISTGLHNSPSQKQKLLAWMMTSLSMLVITYIQDLYLEGGQGVMRVFIDLSLNYVPHEIIKIVAFWLAGGPLCL
jgi:hypothetical protein